jgi:hypothetical protein
MGLIFGIKSKIESRILCFEDLDAKLNFWFHLCVKSKNRILEKKDYKQGLMINQTLTGNQPLFQYELLRIIF